MEFTPPPFTASPCDCRICEREHRLQADLGPDLDAMPQASSSKVLPEDSEGWVNSILEEDYDMDEDCEMAKTVTTNMALAQGNSEDPMMKFLTDNGINHFINDAPQPTIQISTPVAMAQVCTFACLSSIAFPTQAQLPT